MPLYAYEISIIATIPPSITPLTFPSFFSPNPSKNSFGFSGKNTVTTPDENKTSFDIIIIYKLYYLLGFFRQKHVN